MLYLCTSESNNVVSEHTSGPSPLLRALTQCRSKPDVFRLPVAIHAKTKNV